MNSKLLSKTLCLVVLFGVIILQSENAMNGSVHNITLEQLDNINNNANNLLHSQNISEIMECVNEARETLKYFKASKSTFNIKNHKVLQKCKQLENTTGQLLDHAVNLIGIGA